MSYEHLKVSREGPLATVRLNRPEVRNALDETTLKELESCFAGLGKEAGVRAIVLRGEGRDFCAGADVRWMRRAADYGPAQNRKDAAKLVQTLRAVDECPKPVLARIQGGVYGGGLGLVAACDIAVAEEKAVMCFSECRLGILPAVVSSFVLPKVGLAQVRRLYLTGEIFGMALAQRIGLVHEVVDSARLDSTVDRMLQDILKNAPGAVSRAKEYIRRMASLSGAARIRFSVETLVRARSSPEGKEGLSAFLEKRPAGWILKA